MVNVTMGDQNGLWQRAAAEYGDRHPASDRIPFDADSVCLPRQGPVDGFAGGCRGLCGRIGGWLGACGFTGHAGGADAIVRVRTVAFGVVLVVILGVVVIVHFVFLLLHHHLIILLFLLFPLLLLFACELLLLLHHFCFNTFPIIVVVVHVIVIIATTHVLSQVLDSSFCF